MLRVAIDVGPTHGRRTGIGNAVAWTVDALADRDGLELRRYVTSARAHVRSPEQRLPMPAAVALRLWAHRSAPLDRWLGDPDLVHGTNYVVPPTRCPRVVSVYDCWFLDHPDEVRRTIGYIDENPMKIGLPAQRWEFICDYDGWPLHEGHSPRSPYARALRAAGRYP